MSAYCPACCRQSLPFLCRRLFLCLRVRGFLYRRLFLRLRVRGSLHRRLFLCLRVPGFQEQLRPHGSPRGRAEAPRTHRSGQNPDRANAAGRPACGSLPQRLPGPRCPRSACLHIPRDSASDGVRREPRRQDRLFSGTASRNRPLSGVPRPTSTGFSAAGRSIPVRLRRLSRTRRSPGLPLRSRPGQ